MSETLVLDHTYMPVARVPWQRAITLLFQNKVVVEDVYEDRDIRAATVVIKMPAVIRFLHQLRRKKKQVKFSRLNVYVRDKGRCQYCGHKIPLEISTYDHVVPRARGGQTTWDNVVIACEADNARKAARTPDEAGMRLLSKPVRPSWLPEYRFRLAWDEGMPSSWRAWLQAKTDVSYWNTELENDNGR